MELTCMHATGDMVTTYIDRFSHTQWGVCDGTGCMGNSYLTVIVPGFRHMSSNCLGPLRSKGTRFTLILHFKGRNRTFELTGVVV